MRADKGAQGFRDGEGEEKVRPGKLFVQLVVEPLLGFMLLTLGTVAIAAGVIDAVLSATAVALSRGCVRSVRCGNAEWRLRSCGGRWADWDSAQDTLGKGVKDIADGGHEASPRIKALMRA